MAMANRRAIKMVASNIILCRTPFSKSIQAVYLLNCKTSSGGVNEKRTYSSGVAPPSLSSVKRGTGGRSSFSGVVATVFGASGFVGRYVINKLGKVGCQVIVPYRCDHYDVLRLKLCGDLGQILYHPFNLKDEDSIHKAMKYSNVVINLVGKTTATNNFSLDDVNVKGPRTIARIARETGVEKLIHLSALNASANPEPIVIKNGSEFLRSKHRGEQAVLEEFPEAIIFRPASIWGEEDNFTTYYQSLWRLQGLGLPLWNKGRGIFKQPVYVSDVAQGIVNSIFDKSASGSTYECVGPNRYELFELIEWFNRVTRRADEWNVHVSELKWSPLFRLKVKLCEKMRRKYPKLSMERLELEHVTDVQTSMTPTLEDLGVNLTYMEDRIHHDLRLYRSHAYYKPDLGEFEAPRPPKLANLYT